MLFTRRSLIWFGSYSSVNECYLGPSFGFAAIVLLSVLWVPYFAWQLQYSSVECPLGPTFWFGSYSCVECYLGPSFGLAAIVLLSVL